MSLKDGLCDECDRPFSWIQCPVSNPKKGNVHCLNCPIFYKKSDTIKNEGLSAGQPSLSKSDEEGSTPSQPAAILK